MIKKTMRKVVAVGEAAVGLRGFNRCVENLNEHLSDGWSIEQTDATQGAVLYLLKKVAVSSSGRATS